ARCGAVAFLGTSTRDAHGQARGTTFPGAAAGARRQDSRALAGTQQLLPSALACAMQPQDTILKRAMHKAPKMGQKLDLLLQL
ncbi:hypothetical protein HAX54_008885, partial [Datura stramonium]|nr:hypothetical protein [Datura stramonium]